MAKFRVTLIAIAVAGIVSTGLLLYLQRTGRVSQKQHLDGKSEGLDEILDALALSLPAGASANDLNEALRKRKDAAEKLRTNAATFLPELMEEVYAVGRVEATNRSVAWAKTTRLASAFEVLGDEARPLLPKLKAEFGAGRSIGPSVAAFSYIGGMDCGLIVVSGLTNSNPLIRNAAMSAISSFATNRHVAVSAVPPLLVLLKDHSAFSRALASLGLGSLRVEPGAVVPALLQVGKNDPDFVSRTMAIKAIGYFGTNAAVVQPDLDNIAATDPQPSVRRIASVAIRAVKGEISPDEVH